MNEIFTPGFDQLILVIAFVGIILIGLKSTSGRF